MKPQLPVSATSISAASMLPPRLPANILPGPAPATSAGCATWFLVINQDIWHVRKTTPGQFEPTSPAALIESLQVLDVGPVTRVLVVDDEHVEWVGGILDWMAPQLRPRRASAGRERNDGGTAGLRLLSFSDYFHCRISWPADQKAVEANQGSDSPMAFAGHLLDVAQEILRHGSIHAHELFTGAIFNRYTRRIGRRGRHMLTNHDVDKRFIEVSPRPMSEVFRFALRGPDEKSHGNTEGDRRHVFGIDAHSMFPYLVMSRPYPDPASLRHVTAAEIEAALARDPQVFHVARCRLTLRRDLAPAEAAWFSAHHPFLQRKRRLRVDPRNEYGRGIEDEMRIPFALTPGEVFEDWVFSFEREALLPFLEIKPIEGILMRPIEHPVANGVRWLMDYRFGPGATDPVIKALAKVAANVACSSSYRRPWHRHGVAKWYLDPKAVAGVSGFLCHTHVMQAYARDLMFRTLVACRALPGFEAAYVNVDSLHFTVPDDAETVAATRTWLEDNLLGSVPGRFKLEFEGNAGLWAAPRFYWVAKDDEIVCHASLSPDDPMADRIYVDVERYRAPAAEARLGEDYVRLRNAEAWKSADGKRLTGPHYVRRPRAEIEALPETGFADRALTERKVMRWLSFMKRFERAATLHDDPVD